MIAAQVKFERLLMILTLLCCTTIIYAQDKSYSIEKIIELEDLPYKKLLSFSPEEFRLSGYKYNKERNMYKIKNHSTSTILSKLFYYETRNSSDYEMYVYMGKDSIAVVQIYFYDVLLYEALKKWIAKKEIKTYHVKARMTELTEFKYDSFKVSLAQSEKKYFKFIGETSLMFGFGGWSGNYSNSYPAVALDGSMSRRSYPVYIYTITTPVSIYSKWYTKKRDKLNKKINSNRPKPIKPALTDNL